VDDSLVIQCGCWLPYWLGVAEVAIEFKNDGDAVSSGEWAILGGKLKVDMPCDDDGDAVEQDGVVKIELLKTKQIMMFSIKLNLKYILWCFSLN